MTGCFQSLPGWQLYQTSGLCCLRCPFPMPGSGTCRVEQKLWGGTMTNASLAASPLCPRAWWWRRRGTSLSPADLSRRRGYFWGRFGFFLSRMFCPFSRASLNFLHVFGGGKVPSPSTACLLAALRWAHTGYKAVAWSNAWWHCLCKRAASAAVISTPFPMGGLPKFLHLHQLLQAMWSRRASALGAGSAQMLGLCCPPPG